MNRIREVRKRRGLTIAELSKETGISPTSIGNYERGSRKPKADNFIKLCDCLNVAPKYLMGDGISRDDALNQLSEVFATDPGLRKKVLELFPDGKDKEDAKILLAAVEKESKVAPMLHNQLKEQAKKCLEKSELLNNYAFLAFLSRESSAAGMLKEFDRFKDVVNTFGDFYEKLDGEELEQYKRLIEIVLKNY